MLTKENSWEKGKSFSNLEVYQNSYQAMLITFREILSILPQHEKYDLYDQL